MDFLIADMTLKVENDSHMGINNILDLLKEYSKLKIICMMKQENKRKNEYRKFNDSRRWSYFKALINVC